MKPVSKFFLLVILFTVFPVCNTFSQKASSADPDIRIDDLLPILNREHPDYLALQLKHDASMASSLHLLPDTREGWILYRDSLKAEIIRKTGALVHQVLPLDMKETGKIAMNGYSIRNIYFQTRPGIYATANLYIPDGKGKFPGVVVMMGHSINGRFYDNYQKVGASLAMHGYVSLCIDPWGAGERTTIHGVFEDHGDENNLGSSLLNIGETLMGMQITDNIRAVDLLCSLPYVDSERIGATGSSGGGNQTMWLAAMDERVKAAVPVVSAGTFEAYILGSPCICEVLPGGLTFTEESGILSLIAPRALKMVNHQKDDISAFLPREMIRSFGLAQPVFKLMGAENNISYQTFDLRHGYFPEDREVMLGWFDKHLKNAGSGEPVKNVLPDTVNYQHLMTFSAGKRNPLVKTTEQFCKERGNELRSEFLSQKSFNNQLKRMELKALLGAENETSLHKKWAYTSARGWDHLALECSNGHVLPLLVHPPSAGSSDYVIICNPSGIKRTQPSVAEEYLRKGSGVVLCDLSGMGETTSIESHLHDRNGDFRTLARSEYWLGRTLLGEWIGDLNVIAGYLKTELGAGEIDIDGTREAGLTALFLSATNAGIGKLVLRDVPVSYLFDNRDNVDFYSMAVNITGFLKWGDVSLAAALSGADITFVDPLTISGRKVSGKEFEEYWAEFRQIREKCGNQSNISFINSSMQK